VVDAEYRSSGILFDGAQPAPGRRRLFFALVDLPCSFFSFQAWVDRLASLLGLFGIMVFRSTKLSPASRSLHSSASCHRWRGLLKVKPRTG